MKDEKRISGTDTLQKRVTVMPDGRYLIYYTFPSIDREFDSLAKRQEGSPKASSDRKS